MGRDFLRKQKPGKALEAKDYGFDKPNKMVKRAPRKKSPGKKTKAK